MPRGGCWSAPYGWRAVAWCAETAHAAGCRSTGGEHHEAQPRRDHPCLHSEIPGGAGQPSSLTRSCKVPGRATSLWSGPRNAR